MAEGTRLLNGRSVLSATGGSNPPRSVLWNIMKPQNQLILRLSACQNLATMLQIDTRFG